MILTAIEINNWINLNEFESPVVYDDVNFAVMPGWLLGEVDSIAKNIEKLELDLLWVRAELIILKSDPFKWLHCICNCLFFFKLTSYQTNFIHMLTTLHTEAGWDGRLKLFRQFKSGYVWQLENNMFSTVDIEFGKLKKISSRKEHYLFTFYRPFLA